MKGRFRIILVISLVAVLIGLACLFLRQPGREPVYQGKPLQVWLKGFDTNQGSPEYSAAEPV